MSEARITNLSNESNTGGPTISGITTFSGTNYFVPPVGTTAQRPDNPEGGSLRFNTDNKHLEYFKGDTLGWVEVEATSEELDGGHRGVYGPGEAPAGDSMDYITISTLGNSADFGNLTQDRRSGGIGGASRTRGLFAGGQNPSPFTFYNIIDYITFSSVGNATDFSDLLNTTYDNKGTSSATRGLINYGTSGPGFTMVNIIEYITMSSVGTNAQDFGDLSVMRIGAGACASSTRALWGGGAAPGGTRKNIVDYNTIASLGNAIDFGNLSQVASNTTGGSNSVRGLFSLGEVNSGDVNTIDYFTIATLGNYSDFGDATTAGHKNAAVTSPTRLVTAGGSTPTSTNIIDYVQIMTAGNAVDFGDLTSARRVYGGVSNGHGGL